MDFVNFGFPFGASWPSLLPTAPPPIWGTCTDQTDPPSLPNAQLVPAARGTCLTALSEPIPSHSSHTSSNLPLLQYGPPGGEEGDGLEGGQGSVSTTHLEGSSLHTNGPRTPSASDPGAQHKQGPPHFAHAPNPSFQSSHIPMNTEAQIPGKVANREVHINALEKFIKHTFEADGRENDAAVQPLIECLYGQTIVIQKEIADCLDAFSAERQKAGETVSAELANLEAQIHALKQANYHDANVLTGIANTRS